MNLNIAVICGSVRPNRLSILAVHYIIEAIKNDGHSPVLADFTELQLPFVDTLETPGKLKKQYPYEAVQRWSTIVDSADGFVFVSPEYNHSIPGVLKNAIDWLSPEFTNKPAGLIGVSNGAIGGARMIEHLRAVMENFGTWSLKETVTFKSAQNVFDEQGKILDETYAKQVAGLLSSLYKKAEVMKALRS
ncbi:MAG: NAD(P)H-dependent oxidoreductase [bacterium]|nr:NAD(P)H-dependent oxidoreductase [bacterium]